MSIRTFIERPVLSIVISAAMLIVGVIALIQLPVEQFPSIAPPVVEVIANYPGANAATVEKSVVVPLEEAINGVEHMDYISSSSSNNGDAYITVYFKQGTDPDMAAVNVQNRVSTAQGVLPAEVTKVGVTTSKQQKSMLKAVSLYSPDDSYDQTFISNYLNIHVIPKLKRVSGVGQVTMLGSNYSMRIWLKPDKMALCNLTPADVTKALNAQNIESPTGSFGENYMGTFQYTMNYKGRLSTVEEFGNIVIRSQPTGELLRLKDVARIELGDEAYNYRSRTNGHAACPFMIYQTPGSNATQIISEIDKELTTLSQSLPKGLKFVTLQSTKYFLDASIHQVIKTLFEAFVLVMIVVLVFLQDWRSILIPSISILVSLIGTFAFLYLAGFSVNMLTLFALVLAIGIVVDDAIIVVEAVRVRFEIGYVSPYKATIDAMNGITSAIITTTLVFMAVFIPVSFMSGTSGIFYKQFGLTMAAAVGLSAINALILSPTLCVLILKPESQEKQGFMALFSKAFNSSFHAIARHYMGGVLFFIRKKYVVWSSLALVAIAVVFLIKNTKTGLVPDEDTGTVMVNITMPPGSSLSRTEKAINMIDKRLRKIPQIESYNNTSGYGLIGGAGPSTGMFIIKLKPWDERKGDGNGIKAVMQKIDFIGKNMPDVQIFTMAPPLIDGYGVSNGFEINFQDLKGGSMQELYNAGQQFIHALSKRPEIASAYTTFNINFPQYKVDVDAARCERAGTTPDAVLETLSGYFSGSYISNFNRFTKLYRVMMQSAPEYRISPSSLERTYIRIGNEMAPLSQFVTLTKIYGPESKNRFNLYSSITINGSAAKGYSSGDAIRAIQEISSTSMPKGYGYELSGISREENRSTNNTVYIFAFCFIFVYIILCGLYESLLVPFSVLLSVPFGLMGSFIFAKMMGLENNIYMQTGLIMLIGLLSKTAILLTEYATQRRREGMTLVQSAIAAAKARFRPILMTVLAMIFGLLPLMFAHGAGANGNSSLGTSVIGGLLIGSLALLFIVPALFVVFQALQERIGYLGGKVLPVHMHRPSQDGEIEVEKKEIVNHKMNKRHE